MLPASAAQVVFRLTDRLFRASDEDQVYIALHEVATNAEKYGALSGDKGRVKITWETRREGGAEMLHLYWREFGGPPVSPPTRVGFGSRLIERNLACELGGEAHIAFSPEGVEANISTPIERRFVDQWEG